MNLLNSSYFSSLGDKLIQDIVQMREVNWLMERVNLAHGKTGSYLSTFSRRVSKHLINSLLGVCSSERPYFVKFIVRGFFFLLNRFLFELNVGLPFEKHFGLEKR